MRSSNWMRRSRSIEPEPFDILAEYPERELPAFDVLPEAERLDMLRLARSAGPRRRGAQFLQCRAERRNRARRLLELAKSDPDAHGSRRGPGNRWRTRPMTRRFAMR